MQGNIGVLLDTIKENTRKRHGGEGDEEKEAGAFDSLTSDEFKEQAKDKAVMYSFAQASNSFPILF